MGIRTACIGFCRSINNKKLSDKINDYLSGKIDVLTLKNECKKNRIENWKVQKAHGIDIIPSNDFAMYDHMLDATCLVGNIQRRYYWEGGSIPMEIYFSLANGFQREKFDVLPLELQNWLNTNYLYHVPEFVDPIEFVYSDNKPIAEYIEAKTLGIETRSIIISPMSYLLQGKSKESGLEPLDLIDDILPVYRELFINYMRIGVKEVQIDDPMLCFSIDRNLKNIYTHVYEELRKYAGDIKLNLVMYYSCLRENFDFICSLPVDSVHIDIRYNKHFIDDYCSKLNKGNKISIGIVDAQSVWVNNLNESIDIVSKFCDRVGSDNIIIANSSPLFLCPYSVKKEKEIPSELEGQLSFAVEKLDELEIIKDAINNGKKSVKDKLDVNAKIYKKKVTYDNVFHTLEDKTFIKNKRNGTNNWETFLKKKKIKSPAFMFSGEFCDDKKKSFELQKPMSFNIFSIPFLKKSYDVSKFEDFTDGVFTLKSDENVIPRFGCDYYNPVIIYDDPKIRIKHFKKEIEDISKDIKNLDGKCKKLAICSPNHFINFSFISPFIDVKKAKKTITNDLTECFKHIDVDIIQFNDMTLSSGRSLNNLLSVDCIRNLCNELSAFFSSIDDDKCVILYNAFSYISEYLREICKIDVDALLFESARSNHELLNSLISYKPLIPIGFGLFDTYSNRVPTKNELLVATKKILSCIESDKVIFTADSDFLQNKETVDVVKSLKVFNDIMSDVYKNIEKNLKHESKVDDDGEKETKKKKDLNKCKKAKRSKKKVNKKKK